MILVPSLWYKKGFSLNGNRAQITLKIANLLAVSLQYKEDKCSYDAESSNLIILSVITYNFGPFLIPLGSHPSVPSYSTTH